MKWQNTNRSLLCLLWIFVALGIQGCSLDVPEEAPQTLNQTQQPSVAQPQPQPQPQSQTLTLAFVVQPVGLSVKVGELAVLSATASSSSPETIPQYQWFKNNIAIPSATGPTLTFAQTALTDGALYYVLISGGSALAVKSNEVSLVVKRVPLDGIYNCSPQLAFQTSISNYECTTGLKVAAGKIFYAHLGGANIPGLNGVTWLPLNQVVNSTITYMGATCTAKFDPEYGVQATTDITYLAQYEIYKKLDCPLRY